MGASIMRIFQAIRAFFRVLFSKRYAQAVAAIALEAPAEVPKLEDKAEAPIVVTPVVAPPPPREDLANLQVLALLQREGRLLDFLKEDIEGLEDDQIGAAVRAIHKGCRKVLSEHVTLAPIRTEREGAQVEVPPGFDPAAIRLIGNVRGDPPFRGALRHHGWQVTALHLPQQPSGVDPKIVAPAEVEVR